MSRHVFHPGDLALAVAPSKPANERYEGHLCEVQSELGYRHPWDRTEPLYGYKIRMLAGGRRFEAWWFQLRSVEQPDTGGEQPRWAEQPEPELVVVR
jgi:hypothetical protein